MVDIALGTALAAIGAGVDVYKRQDFDLNKLLVVDNIEDYSIKQLMETLNE